MKKLLQSNNESITHFGKIDELCALKFAKTNSDLFVLSNMEIISSQWKNVL